MSKTWLVLLATVVGCAPNPPPTAPPSPAPADDRPAETLRCDESIDAVDELPPSFTSVLDVAALPAIAKDAAAQQVDMREDDVFSKLALLVRAGTELEVLVPAGSPVQLHWTNHGDPVARVIVPKCASAHAWVVFAGGVYAPAKGCLDLVVKQGGREAVVHAGIGAPCPGQRP